MCRWSNLFEELSIEIDFYTQGQHEIDPWPCKTYDMNKGHLLTKVNISVMYAFEWSTDRPTLSLIISPYSNGGKLNNKRAHRALGRSPEEKVKGHSEAIYRGPLMLSTKYW